MNILQQALIQKHPTVVTYYYDDYVPESFKNADFNNDGAIDVRDVTLMQSIITDPASVDADTYAKIDVNYDTRKDVNDVTALQTYTTGVYIIGQCYSKPFLHS